MTKVPSIRSLNMQDIKSFGNLARTNLYQVTIENGWGTLSAGGESFEDHLAKKSLFYDIIDFKSGFKDTLSILCSEATLPASSYATAEVKDNYLGVTQEFAHTRINTDIDFTFYVDRDYKVLMFFEAWMDYISGGNNPELQEPSLYDENLIQSGNYYRRFKYPKQYKNSQIFIKKFERDWNTNGATNISYQLINAFPKSMTSIPLSYGEAEILKTTITMNYDRYVVRREYANTTLADQAAFEQNLLNATGGGIGLSNTGTREELNRINRGASGTPTVSPAFDQPSIA